MKLELDLEFGCVEMAAKFVALWLQSYLFSSLYTARSLRFAVTKMQNDVKVPKPDSNPPKMYTTWVLNKFAKQKATTSALVAGVQMMKARLMCST